jgi:hypothetical protein
MPFTSRHLPFASWVALIGTLTLGCTVERSRAASLKENAASVCKPGETLLITSEFTDRYSLAVATPANVERPEPIRYAVDSVDLLIAIHNILPPRPDKVVMVRLEPRRLAALPWIVAAIERAGGAAYRPDSTCFMPRDTTAAKKVFR